MSQTIKRLREENGELRNVITTLQLRIATLERELEEARLALGNGTQDS
jgi:predicted  nucleic acid-binding Zn-ribbon protein